MPISLHAIEILSDMKDASFYILCNLALCYCNCENNIRLYYFIFILYIYIYIYMSYLITDYLIEDSSIALSIENCSTWRN